MRHQSTHPFHLVDVSPWPILKSFSLLSGALALVSWLTLGINNMIIYIVIISNIVLIFALWIKDVIREGFAGYHTEAVREGLTLGFNIFILTEILLFGSFFWAFFHSALNPSVELAMWPPLGINAIDCWGLPLLNSVLLLSSGFIITWAHHAFIKGDKVNSLIGMLISLFLIFVFLSVQYFEYSYSPFAIADSVFGTIFYAITGLHCLHVIAAFIFILVVNIRIYLDQYTSEHSIGLDISILYFHFTDIVWLGVFFFLYYWGG